MPPDNLYSGSDGVTKFNQVAGGCYFYHIPKTAGMSTWQLLDWAFPKDRIFPGRMWEELVHVPPDTLAHYKAFRGHFLAYLEPFLGRRLNTFTILRDPVERTISHYAHARRAPEHPRFPEANELSLRQFCLDPRTRYMVENYQAAYLACPGGRSPREVAAGMTEDDFRVYRLQLSLDPLPADYPPADQLYAEADQRLRSFVAVGITESLAESLRLIAHRMGWGEPPSMGRVNVAPERPRTGELDEATLRTIRSLTEVDQALYESYAAAFARAIADCADTYPAPPLEYR